MKDTNFDYFYKETLCRPGKDLLWLMYHEDRYNLIDIFNFPEIDQYENIILIDHENLLTENDLKVDPRLVLWDSVIGNYKKIKTYLFWFDWVNSIDSFTRLSSKLVDFNNKTPLYHFDALLGAARKHKNFVKRCIDNCDFKDKILVGACSGIDSSIPTDYIAGGAYDIRNTQLVYQQTGNENMYANPDCFIPYEIYNNTWYSITCETRTSGDCFYTEKTARPLLSQRLFVTFSSQHMLKNLKTLGYETFSSVIDESYDAEPNNIKRWKMAWEQIERLSKENPKHVYAKINEITRHNHDLFTKTDYQKNLFLQIQNYLLNNSK